MVLILDGKSKHVAHALKKKGLFGEKYPICDYSRPNQMQKKTDQRTEIAPYVRIYF